MYLCNLTLFGFKSFVDRLSIDFQPGVTALVGPNGCGKSNIADAIRWVLGEQSSKSLRGDRMEDLIFAGNSHRKPVGIAEVSLTLTNIGGRLAIPYEEVTITRRLYRSGESEYLINQNPCRLKDITRLFLDSGLGREPYALIEQGAIGSLLNSKPADRRILLEEAAGTMSYKVNRNTALGRLQAAEQNLLRVKDVLQEIERQQSSLHRQAKKAERFQRMTRRLKGIQAVLLLQEDRRLEEELDRIGHKERELAAAEESCHLRVSTEETSLEAWRLNDLDLEKRIAAAQERLYTVRGQREREEAEIRSREGSLANLKRRGEEHAQELRAVAEHLQRLLQDLDAEKKTRALTEDELATASRQLQDLHDAVTDLEAKLGEREETLKRRKGEVVTLTEQIVTTRNQAVSLTERDRLLRQERETLERQLTSSRTEAETVSTRERKLTSELQGLDHRIEILTGEREQLLQELRTLAVRQETLSERRATLREELSGLESRLDSLRELEASLAGLSEGQQFLLKGKAAGVPVCQVINGPLSGAVRVEVAWEKAVEALLGDLQQGLLTPTATDALSLIGYLEQEGTGWATLLPRQVEWLGNAKEAFHLQEALAEAEASLDPETAERVAGPALQLVKAPEDLQPLLDALLGDAVIVRDIPTALALLHRLPCPVRVATASGAVLSSRGPIQGGKTVAVSLLSRRREIEELPGVIARVVEELQTTEEDWAKVQDALSHRRQSLSQQEQALQDMQEARHETERSLTEVRTVVARLGSQTAFLDSELTRLEKDLGDVANALQGSQGHLEKLEGEEEFLKGATAEHDRQVTLLRERQQELQREVAEVRIRSTSLQERKEALARSMDRLEVDLERERTREADIRAQEEEDRSSETRLTQEILALQHSLELLKHQEDVEARTVHELQNQRAELRQTLVAAEESLKSARRELTDIQQQRASLATQGAALNTERSFLQKRLQEEAPEGEVLQELLHGGDSPQDPESLEREGEELREKIATMGPINMAALEEYEALSERYRFLTNQAEDLTASVTSLRATIAEINRTIQDLFGKTMTSVSQQLNHFWQRLFGGGEAELVLSEGDIAEEPGVEIRVRIPGKRTTTLSLLSGGEKTLGAIALLMALWTTRPSPFVVLDEVDAALDDVNVDRFASLIKELSPTSQFIFITHHPRTIEVADLLYGITMEEPGISRLISVRLGEQTELAATAATP